MLPTYVLLLSSALLLAAQESPRSTETLDRERTLRSLDGANNALDWTGKSFLDVINALLPSSKSQSVEEERKKKLKLNKYVLPLIVGFLLIKSILLPIALKTLAVLSGKAVVLSLMSLILAAIVGLKKVAQKEGSYDVVNKHRRQDTFDYVTVPQEYEPYRFYAEQRS